MTSAPTHPRCTRLFAGHLMAVLILPAFAAATPRDELLRLVPQDVTFGLVVQDLRERTKPLQDVLGDQQVPPAAFWQGLQLPPPVLAIVKQQADWLNGLDLGVTPRQFLTDIVGDAVVFAYRKGTVEKPDQEQGMLLTWANDPVRLAHFIDRINAYQQKRSGEIVEIREEQSEDGRKFFRRVHRDKSKSDEFYFIHGNVFCFCTSEGLLRATLTLEADRTKVAPLTTHLGELAVEKAFLSWWLNPRSFDSELDARAAKAHGAEQVFLRHFLRYWKATDGIAVFVGGDDRQAEMGLSLRVRKNELPDSARRFLAEAAKPSALWQVIPDDALLAVAGRFEPTALTESVNGFLNEQSRQVIRAALSAGLTMLAVPRNELPALATGLGPDWGAWVFGRSSSADKEWFPQLMFAVRVRDGEDGKRAQDALLDLLQGVTIFACGASKGQIVPEKDHDGEVVVRYLVGDKFPPGLRPAYAAKGGYFLVAGDPDTIRRFKPPAKEPVPGGETPFLRISVKGWLNYLQENRAALAKHFASVNQMPPESVDSIIGGVIEQLAKSQVERLEVVVRSQKADQAAVTIRVKGNPPKK